MKYNLKKSLRVPLTSDELQIEDNISQLRSNSKPEEIEAIRQAASEALASMRGGYRPGAGRKARPHVRTTLLLAPEVREKLERLAERHGNLSLAAEVLIRRARMV
jgi:hypothetical protein